MKIRLKLLDYLVIVLCGAAIAFSALQIYSKAGSERKVVITGRDGEWIYPLDKDRHVDVEGPIGATVVAIEGGKVRIEDSPCPNKTCVSSGAVSEPGQWVACLPNQVFVRVEGSSSEANADVGTY
jgi:hypothetical protein